MKTTVTYTEALIRRAIFRYWVRFISWHGFALIGVCSALCVWAVFWQSDVRVILGSIALWVVVAAIAAGVYVAYAGRSLSKFRRMNDPTVEVTISDDEFRMKTSLSDAAVKWRAIGAIWRFPEAWLLFTGKNAFTALPIDTISTEDRELMCSKVRENGGRVL